jgi:hypothetical protein
MSDTLNHLLDEAERHIHNVLIDQHEDELLPVCVMAKGDGRFIAPTPWRSENEKGAMLTLMRHQMQSNGVEAYCVMSEAWIAVQPEDWKPGDDAGPPPSQRPDRQEVVFACASDKTQSIQRMWRIVRGEAGAIVKLDLDDGRNVADTVGRMAELLR